MFMFRERTSVPVHIVSVWSFSVEAIMYMFLKGVSVPVHIVSVWSFSVEAIIYMFLNGVFVLVHIVILFGRFEWKRICTRFLLFVGYNYAHSVNRNKQLISVTHQIGSCS